VGSGQWAVYNSQKYTAVQASRGTRAIKAKTMEQPEPQGPQFRAIMSDIENGIIKIPQFQRDFVWSKSKSTKLLDSMIKGYPIGTFILWKTKEQLRTVRNIGDAQLPETPEGDYAKQVLDGQQRLTSLFASINGLSIHRDGHSDNFSEIYVDLEATDEHDIVTIDINNKPDKTYVKLVDLMKGGVRFFNTFPEKYHQKLDDYKERLTTYHFSVILVKDAPIDVATEIFTRINTSGQPLTVFEIMVAKTFDNKREFDLAERYEAFIEKLSDIDYGTIPASVVLQSVAAILVKAVGKKEILRLDKKTFIDTWENVMEAIERAVEYFRNVLRIPVSKLLPYQALVVPFSYFFYHHPDRPTGKIKEYLQDFFWRVSLTSRYSRSSESQIEQDLRRIDQILEAKMPDYDVGVDTSASFIRENGLFNAGRAYIKAILCLFAYQEPKSFIDDSQVRISNDWLKRANSKNYHHFFPKAYLSKQGWEDWQANHVANITIVDEFLNKREIRDKAPASYMRYFEKKNPNIAKTMRTHLIRLKSFGIWENDYEKFINRRCRLISKELEKRITPQNIDSQGQNVVFDDMDEEAEAAEEA
jgi:hypothetical protein